MEKFFDKLSSYEILNNLIPGSIFGILLPHFVPIVYPNWSGLEKIIIAYVVGVLISRFGSLLMSVIAKNTALIPEYSYQKYIVASEKDPKIEILNSTGNMYRSLLSTFILLGASWILYRMQMIIKFPLIILISVGVVALIVLMFLSYKKQVDFISKRVDYLTKTDPNLTPTHTDANR